MGGFVKLERALLQEGNPGLNGFGIQPRILDAVWTDGNSGVSSEKDPDRNYL
jgi:hypothetical protein